MCFFGEFFTKIPIDASNIVSQGFYQSILGANNTETLRNPMGVGDTNNFSGISGGYMRMLGLQTFYGAEILEGQGFAKGLVLGFLSSIFMLIVSIFFVIIDIMLVSRFVVVILLIIFSSAAFVALVIPGQKKIFDLWLNSLIGQAVWLPVWFAGTWVVFKLGLALITVQKARGVDWLANTTIAPWTKVATDPKSATALILNYMIIIGFSIAVLVISKSIANKTTGFGAITGAAGIATLGTAAWAGRNTVGRGAKWVAENKRDTWSESAMGRAGLWAANKTAERSFDVRALGGTGVGKAIGADKALGDLGKAGGKGGFSKVIEEKAERKAKYAKQMYGQTPAEAEEAKKLKPQFDVIKKDEEERVEKAESEIARIRKEIAENEKMAKDSSGYKKYEHNAKTELLKGELKEQNIKATHSEVYTRYKNASEAGKRRMAGYAERQKGRFKFAGNVAAARKIMDIVEGKDKKSKKEQAKAMKEYFGLDIKIDDEEGDEGGKQEDKKQETQNKT